MRKQELIDQIMASRPPAVLANQGIPDNIMRLALAGQSVGCLRETLRKLKEMQRETV